MPLSIEVMYMPKKKKVFILGVNGFIGNALAEKLLQHGTYEVSGIDVNSYNIERLFTYKKFHYLGRLTG